MGKPKLFVLDTSVICHDPDCLFLFKENDILIPPTVIKELNGLKKGNGTANRNAREIIRIIAAMPSKEIFNGGSILGDGLGKLRILKKNYPFNKAVRDAFDGTTNDAFIVNTAYCLANLKKVKGQETQQVIFVSKDSILRLQAESLDLVVEDYKNDLVLDPTSLCKASKKIKVSSKIIDKLCNEKEIFYVFEKKLFENEYIILNSEDEAGKKSVLASYSDGKIQLIPEKGKIAPFGIKGRNSEQVFSLSALLDRKFSLVALTGKAGTGKTILAIAAGLQYLDDGHVTELFFTRIPIPVGPNTGFLPGTADEKLSPYMQAMWDNLGIIKDAGTTQNKQSIEDFQKVKKIIIEPIGSIRGRSLVKKYFIIDEAQNLTPHEIKTLITRAGEKTKIILMGDITQIDSPYLDMASNGLSYLISRFRGQSVFAHIHLIKGERSYLATLAGDLL